MATPPRPDADRIDWHRLGAAGTVLCLLLSALAGTVEHSGVSLRGCGWLLLGLVVVLLTFRLVRQHNTPGWWFCWPIFTLALIIVFGGINPEGAKMVPGLIYVPFLYAGLTQPRGRSLLLLPLALAGLAYILQLPFSSAAVRLSIAAFGWSTTAELPALLLRRLVDQQRRLETSAETDVLTGVHNRTGLTELLAEKRGRAFLVLVDLDHFKHYNDSFGHLAGDRVLADFAGMLLAQVRRGDVVVRYGGEEFLVVLSGVDRTVAEQVVNRWIEGWREYPYGVTFSAGVTDLDGDEALGRADHLLYAAKSAGRNRAVVATAAQWGDTATWSPAVGSLAAQPPGSPPPTWSPIPPQPTTGSPTTGSPTTGSPTTGSPTTASPHPASATSWPPTAAPPPAVIRRRWRFRRPG